MRSHLGGGGTTRQAKRSQVPPPRLAGVSATAHVVKSSCIGQSFQSSDARAILELSADQFLYLLGRSRSYAAGNEDGDCRSQRASLFDPQDN